MRGFADSYRPAATTRLIACAVLVCAAASAPGEAEGRIVAPQSAAESLLARSIAFHDPAGHWAKRTVNLTWTGFGADGAQRSELEMSIFPSDNSFAMNGRYSGSSIEYSTRGTTLTARVDGSSELDEETRSRMGLARDGGMFWRDYYGFLAGLPMKLRDPGTFIDPEVTATEFMGRPVDAIRVTYDPEVGGDTWYFYFDRANGQLVGCRFYHDESINDGEYIVFEGLAEGDGLRLPRGRRWYVNADDRFLGEDVIAELSARRP